MMPLSRRFKRLATVASPPHNGATTGKRGEIMKIDDVRLHAYSMPLNNPSFPPGPYRFFNREYFIITYKTDPDALAAVVPEPLEVAESVVKYEFIRMPDSTGFGDYTETGQVIPVRFNGELGAYTHAMYLDDEGPIAGGRELWGFPKKLARRSAMAAAISSPESAAPSSQRVPPAARVWRRSSAPRCRAGPARGPARSGACRPALIPRAARGKAAVTASLAMAGPACR